MSSTVFTPLTQGFSWVDATANVDGSAVVTGEVTGFTIGVRPDGSQPPVATPPGTYPQSVAVVGATATSEAVAAFLAALSLAPGNYFAAVQSTGPANSGWSTEAPFSIPAPVPVPLPPSGFTAA
jgi:hypothetical protein